MTDPKELIERLRAFAKALPNHDWASALLAGYNPTGSFDVSFEQAKAALAADIDALASLSASVGVTDATPQGTAPPQPPRSAEETAKLLAALSLPSSGGEVVGWRWRDSSHGIVSGWHYSEDKPSFAPRDLERIDGLTPLYARATESGK